MSQWLNDVFFLGNRENVLVVCGKLKVNCFAPFFDGGPNIDNVIV